MLQRAVRNRPEKLLMVAVLLLAVLRLSNTRLFVNAWGREGHEIVGNLAWRILSNQTRFRIVQILQNNNSTLRKDDDDSCSPLGSIADWADQVKHTHAYQWSAPLHYIDVRDDVIPGGCPAGKSDSMSRDCRFDYARDCPDDVCVAGAIVNYTDLLLELNTVESDDIDRLGSALLLQESLKFLTHFVGDIHQPLHSSRASDKGGNSIHVHFKGQSQRPNHRSTVGHVRHRHASHHGSNLHSVWDDSIIEKCLDEDYGGSRQALEDNLWTWMNQDKNRGTLKKWLACPYGAIPRCVTAWAQESFEDAIRWAYRNVDGTEILNDAVLNKTYYETRLPVVEQRLLAAGVRLAVTLEIAMGGSFEMTSLLDSVLDKRPT